MTDAHVLSRDGGSLTVSPAAMSQIVAAAAEADDGARVLKRRRGVDVSVRDGHAHAELELAVPYGAVVPDVARGVQSRVAEALAGMCGLEVDAVDVAIEELE